jgi:hypothetical protein
MLVTGTLTGSGRPPLRQPATLNLLRAKNWGVSTVRVTLLAPIMQR